MPEFLTFTSQQATTRALSLWNGSGNDPPPTGWQDPTFDDSGWPLSSNPARSGSVTGAVAPGAEAVAPWVAAPDHHATFLFRSHVPVPPGWQPYTLEVGGASGVVLWIWMQGTQLGPGIGLGGTLVTIDISAGGDIILAGVEGFAFTATDWPPITGGFEAWYSWRLVIFRPDLGATPFAWGSITPGVNDKGVLGTGDTATHLAPVRMDAINFPDPPNFAKVVSNGKTTLLLTGTGDVYACGDNSSGMLGIGTTDASPHLTPIRITTLQQIADIAIGQDCAMALDRWGEVISWGPNAHGSRGNGTTTAQPLANRTSSFASGATLIAPQFIACGDFFSIVATQTTVMTAGANNYGQLGQGTSGADVLTRASVVTTNFPIDATTGRVFVIVDVAAGDGTLAIMFAHSSSVFPVPRVCGRAVFGALGDAAYSAGTGPDHIVTTPMASTITGGNAKVEFAGPLMFQLSDDFGGGRSVTVDGDGTPYGGDGDGFGGGTPWGEGIGFGDGAVRTGPFDHTTGGPNLVAAALANYGGSQNPYAVGNSQAVFAAVGADGKLYTWGWGGAGQMGSGGDAIFNTYAISVSGLTSVIDCAVAGGVMFAIAIEAIATGRASRGWVSVIG